MSTLLRASTGDDWNPLYHTTKQEINPVLAASYWIFFMLITYFIFMNVFMAIIYENFKEVVEMTNDSMMKICKRDIKTFLNLWLKYNHHGQYYLKPELFPKFLEELEPPLGYKDFTV